jgi:hypothetical protein
MTDAALQGIAAQALNMAKRDIEKGIFNFLLASYNEGDGLHRMAKVESVIIERLGENWLGDWQRKAAAFGVLRAATDMMPSDALVFVTAGNGFAATPKFWALPEEKQEALRAAGHERHHSAVAAGLLTVSDVLIAVAQTPERVCIYKQNVNELHQLTGPPQTSFSFQHEFEGILKMFGTP